MSAINVEIPESLLKRAAVMAESEGMSLEQLISTALAEKMSALVTVEHLKKRAKRGSRTRFEAALRKVPAAEPELADSLEPNLDKLMEFIEFTKTLPEKRRRAFTLWLGGYSFREIAELLSGEGIKCTHVRVQIWVRDSLKKFSEAGRESSATKTTGFKVRRA